jgi:hypothetical protein
LAWSPISVRHIGGHIEPKNVRFELRSDPDLVFAWDICNLICRIRKYRNNCNLNGFWDFYHCTKVAADSFKVIIPKDSCIIVAYEIF